MKCLVCGKTFIIKRKIKELFSKQMYLICDECYKAHPLKLNVVEIPLSYGYKAKVLSLFNETDRFNADAYLIEYSKIVTRYLKYYPIMENNFCLCKKTLKRLDVISNLIKQDVFIICNRCMLM